MQPRCQRANDCGLKVHIHEVIADYHGWM
jgi:hypothetical protein